MDTSFFTPFLRGISCSGALRVIYACFPRKLHPSPSPPPQTSSNSLLLLLGSSGRFRRLTYSPSRQAGPSTSNAVLRDRCGCPAAGAQVGQVRLACEAGALASRPNCCAPNCNLTVFVRLAQRFTMNCRRKYPCAPQIR